MRHVLIIGGTTFMGYELVLRLMASGTRITLLNRGRHPDPFGSRVERLVVDRTSPEFAQALRDRTFDAAVDFAAFTASDVQGAAAALQQRVGHYIFISSGAAYLAGEGMALPCPYPLSEGDYPENTRAAPSGREDYNNWKYGADKRAAEAVLVHAYQTRGFPATRLRLPIVNGARDAGRRLESYVWRLMDQAPVLLPDGGNRPLRHVYVEDVVQCIAGMLGNSKTYGQAYNLSQDEQPTLQELLSLAADMLNTPKQFVSVPQEALEAAGLSLTRVSPFSGQWSSRLDAAKARDELGFRHQPLLQYLEKMAAAWFANWPASPPRGYEARNLEITLAHQYEQED